MGMFYLLLRRRRERNGDGHVTRAQSGAQHQEVLLAIKALRDQAVIDQQNLFQHVSNHSIHGD